MDTSDDALFNPPKTPDIAFSAPKTAVIDPDVTDPDLRKRKKRQATSVLTEDWAAPVLGNRGALGLGDSVS